MKAPRIVAIAAGLAAIGAAGTSLAQNMATGPGYSGHITDTRTGKVWTPSLDSLDAVQPTNPNHPVNREFDPRAQRESVPGLINQRPKAELMGTVPITAGPSVPVMTLDAPSLQAVPGQRWIAILYVTNNSGNSFDAIVDCHFTNHGQKVESVRLHVPTAGPGERLGVPVRGPRVDMFVDKVTCVPMSPI
jgi:hypothetical protein